MFEWLFGKGKDYVPSERKVKIDIVIEGYSKNDVLELLEKAKELPVVQAP